MLCQLAECTNNFVQVEYKEAADPTILCVFTNQSDIPEKACCIAHYPCDQEDPQDIYECDEKLPYTTEIEVSVASDQQYCYTAIASNGTYTVKIKGSFITGISTLSPNYRMTLHYNKNPTFSGFDLSISKNNSTADIAIIAVTSSCLVVFPCVIVIVSIMLFIYLKRKWRSGYQPLNQNNEDDSLSIGMPVSDSFRIRADPLKHYLIPYHLPDMLRLHEVGSDCELRQYVSNTLSVEFKRGHTYYEFTNEVENILEGKEVLLQDRKNSKKWFRLAPPEKVAAEDIKLYGEGISRSTFGHKYSVFVQSFGSGTRHLRRDSCILYNHEDQVINTHILHFNLYMYVLIRWSLMPFSWCLFALKSFLTQSLTQRNNVYTQLKTFVHKIV